MPPAPTCWWTAVDCLTCCSTFKVCFKGGHIRQISCALAIHDTFLDQSISPIAASTWKLTAAGAMKALAPERRAKERASFMVASIECGCGEIMIGERRLWSVASINKHGPLDMSKRQAVSPSKRRKRQRLRRPRRLVKRTCSLCVRHQWKTRPAVKLTWGSFLAFKGDAARVQDSTLSFLGLRLNLN